MKPLAVALLLLVAVTHFGHELIAGHYQDHEAAAKAWFYTLRGVEGAALFLAVAALSRSAAVIAVCSLGAFEESMTAACRASKPIAGLPGYLPFQGLCGPGWYYVGLIALGLVALALAYDLGRGRGKKRA